MMQISILLVFSPYIKNCLSNVTHMTFFIDRWAEIPGGPLWFSPYTEFNKSYHSEDELSDTKGFVLMSTKFNNKANISAIEFVPMNEVTNGKLIIEVCIIGFGLIKSIRIFFY